MGTRKAPRTDPQFETFGTFEKDYLWVFVLSFLILFKTQWPKTTEAEEFGSLTFPQYSPSLSEVKAGTQGRNLEAETEAETTEEHCLVACFFWLAHPAFLYNSGPPALGQYYPRWTRTLHQIIIIIIIIIMSLVLACRPLY